VTGLLVLLAGLFLLWMVWSDSGNIRGDWEKPSRFWKHGEYWRSRSPSQPLNLVLPTVLGACGVVYGVIALGT